jgi:hypothetical protein
MKAHRHHRKWPWLAMLALFGALERAVAQARYFHVEEPQLLKLDISEASTGVYTEGNYEDTSFRNSNTSVSHDRLFVGPSLGLNLNGSVYHPNLFQYQLVTEGAYGWSQDTLQSGGTTVRRNELEYLGRFSGNANILANKPLHTTVFGDYDHTYRDYDFFSRVQLDTWRYGLRTAYTAGPFSFTANYSHRDEETSGFNGLSTWQQDVLGFNAHHERKWGGTTFSYTLDRYKRDDFGSATRGTDHTFSLADSETFGSQDQMRLVSSASYSLRESDIQPNQEAVAGANLTVDHRDNLSSLYDVNFDHYSSGFFASDNLVGSAALRHKLYESLISTLSLRAVDYQASDQLSSGFTRRYGIGLAENYTKHLSEDHRLIIDGSVLGEHVDQQNDSTVENEAHSFIAAFGGAPPNSFFLNLTQVDPASIRVWSVGRSRLFLEGIHYRIFQDGALTRIERVIPSNIDPDVVVDYQAKPTPAGHYEQITDTFGVRFELWKNFWGIYGRFSSARNNAPKELGVQSLAIYTVGSDVTWRWLRAGAEYSIYDSDLSSYKTARLFESLAFNLDDDSSAGLDFSQTWTDYTAAQRHEDDYRFVTNYRRRLTSHLRIEAEGGFDLRRGEGVDQTLATFRPGIDYVIGRTTIKAGYDFEYNIFLRNEVRLKHIFFVRVKRIF